MKRPERTIIRIIGLAIFAIACLFAFDAWLRVAMAAMGIVLILMS